MTIRITIPQGTGTSVGSGVTTYTGLIATLAKWLNRSDLGDDIPDFITLLEDRLNRILRVPEMEEQVTISTTAERLDLPTDWREVRNVYLDTDPRQPLQSVSLAVLRSNYACQATGRPQVYAISGSEIVLGPSPDDTYSLILDYYKEIPALSAANETNWLISKHPSIYLYGALVMAEAFIWDDERLKTLWKPAWDEALGELMAQGNRKRYGASPLRLRASVSE